MLKQVILLLSLAFAIAASGSEYIVEMESGVPLITGQVVEKIADDIYLVKSENKFLRTNLTFGYGVKTVEPNHIYRVPEVKEDLSSKQWALYGEAGVNAELAWAVTEGSKDIVVAVIDTGVDYTHPELVKQMWTNEAELNGEKGVDDDENGFVDDIYGYDFQNNDGDPMDDHSHGTHCAGVIGASHDGVGTNGMMKNVRIMALKFLGAQGGSTAGAIASINYATKMKANVMSNSWGGGPYSSILGKAIAKANEAGIVFTAAAGNSSRNNDYTETYPANYPGVIAVAAHTKFDKLAYFSNHGIEKVHVSAPGSGILSSVLKGKYKSYSGTSMATPYVSGIVGLLLSIKPEATPEELRTLLMETSVKGKAYTKKVMSGGRVDAAEALLSL